MEQSKKGFNEDEEQRVRRAEEVEGHKKAFNEDLPEDDAPEVEGHIRLSPERKYKKA